MRLSLVLPIVAAFAAIAIGSPEPAAAKPLNSCQVRHSFCVERCTFRGDIDTNQKLMSCIQRTCDHQFKSCSGAPSSGSGGGAGKTGRVVRDKRRRLDDASRTSPVTRPDVAPRPTTTGSNATDGSGRPAVRDHRAPRATPTVRNVPFGIGPVKSGRR